MNPNSTDNLFYWFFRHEIDDKPLIIMLNGGPGASSMYALFVENGPIRVNKTSVYNASSWADDHHLVFIDQPVQTGFSYGNITV